MQEPSLLRGNIPELISRCLQGDESMATGISCFGGHSSVLTVARSNEDLLLQKGHVNRENIQNGSKMSTVFPPNSGHGLIPDALVLMILEH